MRSLKLYHVRINSLKPVAVKQHTLFTVTKVYKAHTRTNSQSQTEHVSINPSQDITLHRYKFLRNKKPLCPTTMPR